MPLYVYQCEKGHTKEAWSSISEREKGPECDCGLSMKMIITPVRVNGAFLGSYRNPGYKCPVTNEWVETKRKRLNIMAKHDLVEYTGRTAPKPEA